jgi:hypothetical protein
MQSPTGGEPQFLDKVDSSAQHPPMPWARRKIQGGAINRLKIAPFALLALACALVFCACHKDAIQPLQDGAKLRADAARMLDDLPLGDVSKYQWPASIKALKPLAVTREPDNIRILLAHQQGKFSMGYHVFRDAAHPPSTRGVWIEKTESEGIYIYKTQY